MTELVGRKLLNRDRVDEFVGHGGMADVYQVFDAKRAVKLAIKVLRPDVAHEPDLHQRFTQEAHLLETLTHPHIVRFYDWHQAEGLMFIVMDYVAGSNLREVIKRRAQPFPAAELVWYAQPIATALHYAHQQSVFHCDVKPSNVLVGVDNRVYVSDFGVARIMSGIARQGTPTHMAPEQFQGGLVDARTDVYALGVLLFELATGGNRPFVGESHGSSGATLEERIGWEHQHQPPPPPRQYNSAVSPALEAVILRALEKQPASRFGSMLELLAALETLNAPGRPASPEAPRQPPPGVNQPRQNRPEPGPTAARPADRVDSPPPKAPRPGPPAGQPLRKAAARIIVRSGDTAGQAINIDSDPWVIGRSQTAHLRLSGSSVSRQHASIRRGPGYFYIQDMGSTLGTFVNGRRIAAAQAIREGDIIRLGNVELEFRESRR